MLPWGINSLVIAPNERATAVMSKVRFAEPVWVQEVSEKSFISHLPLLPSSIWLSHEEVPRTGVCTHGASTNKEQVLHARPSLILFLCCLLLFSVMQKGAPGLFRLFLMFTEGWIECLCGLVTVDKSKLQLENQRATKMVTSLQSPATYLGKQRCDKLMSKHSLKAWSCWNQYQTGQLQ